MGVQVFVMRGHRLEGLANGIDEISLGDYLLFR